MGIIFDSCIWIGLAGGKIEAQVILEIAAQTPIYTSVITLGELAFGVESCADLKKRAQRIACLRQLENRPVLSVTRHTALQFGRLAAEVKQSGKSPRPRYNDLWIAAQAIEHQYQLLTLNAGDFANLSGLRLIAL
jgi:predicted nucleic acid-binding protein